MKKHISINNLVNNDTIADTIYNLYLRWLDEWQYEDINDYGVVVANAVRSVCTKSDVVLLKSSHKPFGFVLAIDGQRISLFVKEENDCITICGNLL